MNMEKVNQTLADLQAKMGPLVMNQVKLEEEIEHLKHRIKAATTEEAERSYRRMLMERTQELEAIKRAMRENRSQQVDALHQKHQLMDMEITSNPSLTAGEREERRLLQHEIIGKVKSLQTLIAAA